MRRIKMRQRSSSKQGFTLVELSLSIVFIGILSLTIALIINNSVSSYRRGVTLNQVNTVGMELVDDIRRALQASPPNREAICGEDEGCKRTSVKHSDNVDIDGKSENVPMYGAVCTGQYSYVWNSGYVVKDQTKRVGVNGESNFRLAKFSDPINDSNNGKETICSKNDGSNNNFVLPDGAGGMEVLLANDDGNSLALYDFTVEDPAVGPNGKTAFYSASFILGTVEGGININETGNFCKEPKNGGGAFDYCAINKFNFAAQATGGKSVE